MVRIGNKETWFWPNKPSASLIPLLHVWASHASSPSSSLMELLFFGFVVCLCCSFCFFNWWCCFVTWVTVSHSSMPFYLFIFFLCGDFFNWKLYFLFDGFISDIRSVLPSFNGFQLVAIVEVFKQAKLLPCFRNRLVRSISWLLA